MRIINNRYIITEEKDSIGGIIYRYIAEDMYNSNSRLEMLMVEKVLLTNEVYLFLKQHFLMLSGISDDFFLKSSSFSSVIDNDGQNREEFVFFTFPEDDSAIPLSEWMEEIDVEKQIVLFHRILKALNYTNMRGIRYSYFKIQNLFIKNGENDFQLKHANIIYAELENLVRNSDDLNKIEELFSFYNSAGSLDLEKMSAFFVSILELRQEVRFDNLIERINVLKQKSDFSENVEDKTKLRKLIGFVESLQTLNDSIDSFYLIFENFSEMFGLDTIIEKESKVTIVPDNTIFIGRDYELTQIEKLATQDSSVNERNVVVIKGDSGVGKTRLLKELAFSLKMENINVVKSFNTSLDDSDVIWEDFTKTYTNIIYEIYSGEKRKENLTKINMLKRILSDFHAEEDANRYKMGYKAASLLAEIMPNQKIVFLVDNFEYANSVIIEFILFLITDGLLSDRLLFVISLNTALIDTIPEIKKFLEIIDSIGKSKIVELENLSLEDTSKLVKAILFFNCSDIQVANAVYEDSFGKPQLIYRKVNELITNSSLYLNEYTGRWEYSREREKEIAINLNVADDSWKLNDLNDDEQNILELCSCYSGNANIETISKILELQDENAYEMAEKLKTVGLLTIFYEGKSRFVTFYNENLKKKVYNSIEENERNALHKKILASIDDKSEGDIIEQLFQYRACGMAEKAKEKAINIAQLRSKGNLESSVRYYNLALQLTDCRKANDIIEISLKISNLYLLYGNQSEALKVLVSNLSLQNGITKQYLRERYIYTMARLCFALGDKSTLRNCYKAIDRIKKEDRSQLFTASKEKMRADLFYLEGDGKRATEIYYKLIRLHQNDSDYDYILSDCYRFIAFIQEKTLPLNTKISMLNLAGEASKRLGDLRGEFVAKSNIAFLTMSEGGNYRRAIEMFKDLLETAKEHSIVDVEIMQYTHLAVAHGMLGEYNNSLDYLKTAERRIEVTGVKSYEPEVIFNKLTYNLALGNYAEFMSLVKKYKNTFENSSKLKLYVYDLLGDYYFALRDYSSSITYLKKAIKRKGVLKYEIQDRKFRIKVNKMLMLGEFHENVFVRYIDYLAKEKHPYRVVSRYQRLQNIIYIFSRRMTPEPLVGVLKKMRKLEGNAITNYSKLNLYYLNSLLYHKNNSKRLELLTYANEYSDYFSFGSVSVAVSYDISYILSSYGYKEEPILYMLDAVSTAIKIMEKIPLKYHVSYYNHRKFNPVFNFFYRLMYFNEAEFLVSTDRISGAREIWRNINNIAEEIKRNTKEPIDNAVNERLKRKGISRNIEDVVKAFSNDRKANVDLLLEYFSIITLATKAYILRNNGFENYSAFSSFPKGNEYDTNVVAKHLDKMHVTQKKGKEISPELSGVEQLIGFPMHMSMSERVARDTGYIVFLSDKVFNKFDELSNNYQYLDLILLSNMMYGYDLKQSASIDKLTGALTRKYLDEALNVAVRYTASGRTLSIALLDLDKFKGVNDTYGHQVGDLVLSETIGKTLELCPPHFRVGRYGGEEFVIVMPDTDVVEAYDFAENLRKEVERVSYEGYSDLKVTVSIGIKNVEANAEISVQDLVEHADRALYRAKGTGRNKTLIYRPEFETKSALVTNTYGVLSGNDMKDERIIASLTEMLMFKRTSISQGDIISDILTRSIQLLEAKEAGAVIFKRMETVAFRKVVGREHIIYGHSLTPEMIQKIRESAEGINLIDWDDISEREPYTKLPIWNSMLGIRIQDGRDGIIYFKVPSNIKLFQIKDLNMARIISNVISMYISTGG